MRFDAGPADYQTRTSATKLPRPSTLYERQETRLWELQSGNFIQQISQVISNHKLL